MFLLACGFYIINRNSRWTKTKSNFSQREGFTSLCLWLFPDFNSDQDCTTGNVASTAITTTSTIVAVSAKIQPQFQQVNSCPFITLTKMHLIRQENKYYLARDSGFKVQDSKRNVWQCISKKKYHILENQSICLQ